MFLQLAIIVISIYTLHLVEEECCTSYNTSYVTCVITEIESCISPLLSDVTSTFHAICVTLTVSYGQGRRLDDKQRTLDQYLLLFQAVQLLSHNTEHFLKERISYSFEITIVSESIAVLTTWQWFENQTMADVTGTFVCSCSVTILL